MSVRFRFILLTFRQLFEWMLKNWTSPRRVLISFLKKVRICALPACFIWESATSDSVLCGSNSFENLAIVNKEISRVLKPGGSVQVN